MFDLYGVGLRQAFSTPNLLKELNLKVTQKRFTISKVLLIRFWVFYQIGRLSTGDSLDMSTQDESLIISNDATLKDMEVNVILTALSKLLNLAKRTNISWKSLCLWGFAGCCCGLRCWASEGTSNLLKSSDGSDRRRQTGCRGILTELGNGDLCARGNCH